MVSELPRQVIKVGGSLLNCPQTPARLRRWLAARGESRNILLAGGVFNAVLVPQLVRAGKEDPDGGAAYTNRVVTLAMLFLGAVTVLLVAFAPQVMDIYLSSSFDDPDLAPQLESVVALARYCLPQVFFYGMFVLVGQILNARGLFGPMMWAPIANNVISVLVLVGYLLVWGPASGPELEGAYDGAQEAVLGIGSTLGIAAQLHHRFPEMARAPGRALGERASVGVDGDAPVDHHPALLGVPVFFEEAARLAGRAPAEIFDPAQGDDAEAVVGEEEIHVGQPDVALFLQGFDHHVSLDAHQPRRAAHG